MQLTKKQTRQMANLTRQLTNLRKLGLGYDQPEVIAVTKQIDALCWQDWPADIG